MIYSKALAAMPELVRDRVWRRLFHAHGSRSFLDATLGIGPEPGWGKLATSTNQSDFNRTSSDPSRFPQTEAGGPDSGPPAQ